MDFLSPEAVQSVLGKAAQSDLASYLIIVGVVWKVMGSKVSDHFQQIESGLKSVAQEVANLRGAVQADLKVQTDRLDKFEDTVIGLSERVKNLEITKGKE